MLDREEARRIYTELLNQANYFAMKHDFPIERDKRVVKSKV